MIGRKLTLKKTHDRCVSGKPALTVVLIHGIAATSATYKVPLKYLEGTTSLKNVRFVTFDLLGWGESKTSDKLSYDYDEQIEALHNSIEKLKIDTPLVLVGHSMGTLVVTRYANTYKRSVKELILISPPIYTEEDMESPVFADAAKAFQGKIAENSQNIAKSRSFELSMQNIVMNKRNYAVLKGLKTHTVLIWGSEDAIIASQNIPGILAANPKYLTAIETPSGHHVTKDKYMKLVPILERLLNA